MYGQIDVDLFKNEDGDIYFILEQREVPSIAHNSMIPQAIASIAEICKKYNLFGFTLYLDPITPPPEPDD